jgi:hypothetical protein
MEISTTLPAFRDKNRKTFIVVFIKTAVEKSTAAKVNLELQNSLLY